LLSLSASASRAMNVLAAYDRALTRQPMLVKTLTSAALFGLGDVMSQKLEGKAGFDWSRLARATAWGTMFAPLAHMWYGQLEKLVPGKGAVVVAKKVALDQASNVAPRRRTQARLPEELRAQRRAHDARCCASRGNHASYQ
jgi:hypothetical protein